MFTDNIVTITNQYWLTLFIQHRLTFVVFLFLLLYPEDLAWTNGMDRVSFASVERLGLDINAIVEISAVISGEGRCCLDIIERFTSFHQIRHRRFRWYLL